MDNGLENSGVILNPLSIGYISGRAKGKGQEARGKRGNK
ncbi:hypothetical protein MICAE_330001 [Microcystis aeruginosa PCC 9806]|uniref:Uncharacterized protein n=1 Tax=Microcystis aeruginosa PCC 9806 TaxID=1160282 RepID=I4GXP5_MICAE|nr:hypothetical protein MICAE_330001 [Microcystis aeruginosa PCC 9806]